MQVTAHRFACYVLVLAEIAAGCGNHNSTYHGGTTGGGIAGAVLGSVDVGALAYDVVHGRLAAEPGDGPARAAALEARRDEFVAAIDTILTAPALRTLGTTIGALVQLVDDGTLPDMTEEVARILEALVAEPGQPTLDALVSLGETRFPIGATDLMQLGSRMLSFRETVAGFGALADLIGQAGAPLQRSVQGAMARLLRRAAAPAAAGAAPGLLDGVGAELLAESGAAVPGGRPAYAVAVDRWGNPAVARDPATGGLYAPFVDRDGDGAADVDAAGDPVDAAGGKIDLAAFGTPFSPGRDADGRALAADGRPTYVYVDARATLLAHFLALVGEALRRGIVSQAIDSAAIALGPRTHDDAGTPLDPSDDFAGFFPDNPVRDLSWGGLALLEIPETAALLRSLAALERQDPALWERLLVTYGRIVDRLRPISPAPAGPASPASIARADRLIELLDRLFADGGARPSTGRVLLDLLHDLGASARRLPQQLALLARYRTLAVDAAGQPIPGRSELVDFSLGPTAAGSPAGENRSILQQLVTLFADADGCGTFIFAGKPLSESLLDVMAAFSPATLTTLVQFIDNPILQAYVAIACPAIQSSLASVKGLAASGALEAFVPLIKVFVDRGESRLFIELVKIIAGSYDDVRAIEPDMASVLESGAIDPLFDLVDALVAGRGGQAVVDPVTGARALDVVADLFSRVLAHPAGGVADRRGVARPTLLHLVLEPLRRLDDAAAQTPGGAAGLRGLYVALTDLFVERATGDKLANPSVAPFLAHVLDLIARNLATGDAARAAQIGAIRASADSFLASADFATLFDAACGIRFAAGGAAMRAAVADMLTPAAVATDDGFGSLARLMAQGLEAHLGAGPLGALLRFTAGVIDPANGRVAKLLEGFGRLLAADRGRAALALLRNALAPAPAGSPIAGRPPLAVLASVLQDLRGARTPAPSPATRAERVQALARALQEGAEFIRDSQSGLRRIFDVIRNRRR